MSRILIVDDDKGSLNLIEIMLERGGFEVTKADSGRLALSLLNSAIPDLVILDVMMPEMSGIDVCKAIREKGINVPILILSARGDAQAVMHSLEAGATDYLPKPILHHDLVAKVRQMLNLA
jgi:DNA-binding response OmpR family regulator